MDIEAIEKKIKYLRERSKQISKRIEKNPEFLDHGLRNDLIKEQLELKGRLYSQAIKQIPSRIEIKIGTEITFHKDGKEQSGIITAKGKKGATIRDKDGNRFAYPWTEMKINPKYIDLKVKESLLRELGANDFFIQECEIIKNNLTDDNELNLEFFGKRINDLSSALDEAMKNKEKVFRNLLLRDIKKRVDYMWAYLHGYGLSIKELFICEKHQDFLLHFKNFHESPYSSFFESPYITLENIMSYTDRLPSSEAQIEFLKDIMWLVNLYGFHFLPETKWDYDILKEIAGKIDGRIMWIKSNIEQKRETQEKIDGFLNIIRSDLLTLSGKQEELKEDLKAHKETVERQKKKTRGQPLIETFIWAESGRKLKALFEILIDQGYLHISLREKIPTIINKLFIVEGEKDETNADLVNEVEIEKIQWQRKPDNLLVYLIEELIKAAYLEKGNEAKLIKRFFLMSKGEAFKDPAAVKNRYYNTKKGKPIGHEKIDWIIEKIKAV